MFGEEDRIETFKLIDFGLSTTIDEVENEFCCGTVGYLCPELFSATDTIPKYQYAHDIFSAGVIFYKL